MEHHLQLPDIQATLLHQLLLALIQPLDILPLQASTQQPQVMLLHQEPPATHHLSQAILPHLEATCQQDLAIHLQLLQVHQVILLLLVTHHMEEHLHLVLLEPTLQALVVITSPLHTDVDD